MQFDVQFDGDTIWLTQAQIATIFETTRENITMHFSQLFKSRELSETAVCKQDLHTGRDNKVQCKTI